MTGSLQLDQFVPGTRQTFWLQAGMSLLRPKRTSQRDCFDQNEKKGKARAPMEQKTRDALCRDKQSQAEPARYKERQTTPEEHELSHAHRGAQGNPDSAQREKRREQEQACGDHWSMVQEVAACEYHLLDAL
jgi:hypothetical protein